MMPASQAREILAGLDDVGRAVLQQMAHRRHLEAHRILTLALGDGMKAKEIIASIIAAQIMKR